jgi:hypothetical protein
VVEFIAARNPDVFALYEVKGRQVFADMVAKMPDYHITITESESLPESLVGVRNRFFSFVTQRKEIASRVASLRPGALATNRDGGQDHLVPLPAAEELRRPAQLGSEGMTLVFPLRSGPP